MRASVLVRTVAGLEGLAADEVAAAGHRVVEVSKRQLIVEGEAGALVRRPPRVADDLFVVVGSAPDPGRAKAGLAAAVRAAARTAPAGEGALAVSASFVGERNFNRYDVEDCVGERLARLTGGAYYSRRGGAKPPELRTDWRVVLDGKTLWVARRPYAEPLHRRPWRRRTVQGSLHPPVAAAMARLADLAPDHAVLDPFCGAGTLLLEAQAIEPRARYAGVDRDREAVAAARANAAAHSAARAGTYATDRGDRGDRAIDWVCADSATLTARADRIITNPPWNRRRYIGDLAPYLRAWRRTLNGLLVALVMPEQVAGLRRGWRVCARYEIAVAGQHPIIVVADSSR
ncbi:methyltransferase [Kribbella sp. NPDC048915]|uniref:methyltransferase domain-containing protein n=1 Tax=Kribbella sp. NPDC048915 TaxID=3155148 RepID=UPI0034066218